MPSVNIDRLAVKYVQPAGQPATSAALDRLILLLRDDLLDRALECADVPATGYTCIRSVRCSTTLPLDWREIDRAALWARAIAMAVSSRVRDRGPDFVYYASWAHALLDFVLGLSRDDLARAWAWRQLGLWTIGQPGDAIAAALRSRPDVILPLVRALAHTAQLRALARVVPERDWPAIVRAAARATGIAFDPAGLPADAPQIPEPLVRRIQRLPAVSVVCREAEAIARESTPVVRRSLAALVLLEAEPAAFARVPRLVVALERNWIGSREIADEPRPTMAIEPTRGTPPPDAASKVAAAEPSERAATSVPDERPVSKRAREDLGQPATGPRPAADALRDSPAVARDRSVSPEGDETIALPSPGLPVIAGEVEARRETQVKPVPAQMPDEEARAEAIVRDTAERRAGDAARAPGAREALRVQGRTRFGGLLFLVHLIHELRLPDAWHLEAPLSARPLRWCLHQLGQRLLEIAPADPALLALAGLRPGDRPPTIDAEAATAEEDATLREAAASVGAALVTRLGAEPDDAHADGAYDLWRRLVRRVAMRNAEVVADAGWMEIRFSLDQVDTELRRAGLDLDPGYVPWLGVVLRFVYA